MFRLLMSHLQAEETFRHSQSDVTYDVTSDYKCPWVSSD
jgi:hypothetical protein